MQLHCASSCSACTAAADYVCRLPRGVLLQLELPGGGQRRTCCAVQAAGTRQAGEWQREKGNRAGLVHAAATR
jgi:hypothetical protein